MMPHVGIVPGLTKQCIHALREMLTQAGLIDIDLMTTIVKTSSVVAIVEIATTCQILSQC